MLWILLWLWLGPSQSVVLMQMWLDIQQTLRCILFLILQSFCRCVLSVGSSSHISRHSNQSSIFGATHVLRSISFLLSLSGKVQALVFLLVNCLRILCRSCTLVYSIGQVCSQGSKAVPSLICIHMDVSSVRPPMSLCSISLTAFVYPWIWLSHWNPKTAKSFWKLVDRRVWSCHNLTSQPWPPVIRPNRLHLWSQMPWLVPTLQSPIFASSCGHDAIDHIDNYDQPHFVIQAWINSWFFYPRFVRLWWRCLLHTLPACLSSWIFFNTATRVSPRSSAI